MSHRDGASSLEHRLYIQEGMVSKAHILFGNTFIMFSILFIVAGVKCDRALVGVVDITEWAFPCS